MEKLLAGPMSDTDANAVGSLALAHIGDAVFELLVRKYLIDSGYRNVKILHKHTVAKVSAGAQAASAAVLLPLLDEAESAVYMRGRNTRLHSCPKNADRADYQTATALESLFGYLYLTGRAERAAELFFAILADMNAEKDGAVTEG